MPNAIHVKQLSFKYNSNDYYSLSDISLTIKAHKCTGIIGPNGAGKSTFISALCGLLPHFEGEVFYEGDKDVPLLTSVKQKVALVPQEYAFYLQLTVLQNLKYFLSMCGTKKTKAEQNLLLNNILEQCALSHVCNSKVNKLSGGYKRRLNIAIALVKEPSVLFLDEPTVGIDPESRAIIISLLKQFKQEGKTLLFTSHMLDEVEKICDDIIMLRDGKATCMDRGGRDNILLSVTFSKQPSKEFTQCYQCIDAFNYQRVLTSESQLNECLIELAQLSEIISQLNYSTHSVERIYQQGIK